MTALETRYNERQRASETRLIRARAKLIEQLDTLITAGIEAHDADMISVTLEATYISTEYVLTAVAERS